MQQQQPLKAKKPTRLRLLQPYLPRQYFDTLQHTLDRHTKHNFHSQATDSHNSHTISVHNPFQRKPQRAMQPSVQKVAAYLQRKITANDFNRKSRQHQSLRYEQSQQAVRRNPYSKSKNADRRQSLLDKSNKIRSGSMASPTLNRYPRSSMSNPYEPRNKHRRVVSISRNYASRDQTEQNSTQILLEQGRKLSKEGKHQKAIEIFERVLLAKNLIEAKYLLAVSYMNSGQSQKAINAFYEVIQENPDYRKNVYILTAIAYKRMNQLDSALAILNKGLKVFTDDYDCYVYRGKLHMRMGHYDNAAADFSSAINIAPSKGFSYIGRADCLKSLNRVPQAIEVLTQALTTDLKTIAYLKRGIYHFQLAQYKQCLSDLELHLASDNTSSQAHFYRGMAYLKIGNISQALLSFDETLKLDNNSSYVAKAVQQILKIRITEKDFYQAYHVVARADNLDIQREFVEDWKTFVEGTLLLMKKKYKQGVDVLTGLLQKGYFSKALKQVPTKTKDKHLFLKPLIHLYRAYGYFSTNQLHEARMDYNRFDQFCNQAQITLNEPTKQYNMMLIRAIQGFPNHSVVFLEQAIRLYPSKTEPYLYLALALTQDYIVSQETELVDKIRSNLDKAVSFLPQLSNNHISNVYYHRAVVNLYVNDFDKAVADIDKAIEKSEDNIPRYFYLRGLIFACCGNFTQAVQDLSVAVNLDDRFAKAYLERAKCLQMEGNPNQAFLDLQKYITLKPDDPQIHKYAGFLLFQNCAYEDCLSAFAHGSELLSDIDIIETKAKCYFVMGKLGDCLDNLEQYEKQSGDVAYIVDSIAINLLRNLQQNPVQKSFESSVEVLRKLIASKKNQGKFFKLMDLHLLLAASLGELKRHDQSISEFQRAVQLKMDKQKEEKQALGDDSDDEDTLDYGWTIVEATFCIVLCHLAQGDVQAANDLMAKVDIKNDSAEQSWLLQFRKLISRMDNPKTAQELTNLNNSRQDQDKQLSRFFPPLKIPVSSSGECLVSFQFSYPQLDPPELLPEFDHQLLLQFQASKIQPKPEAPWITRNSNGVVFTPNVQVFQNLELSATSTAKKNEQQSAQMEDSVAELSERLSGIPLDKKDLKAHFRLDSQTELKLQRLLNKK